MKITKKFLPICKEDLEKSGIDQLDFIIVTGDAYVDHPSFGTAIIGRVLESEGFTVGIIAQPNWKTTDDFKKLGKPKYGFLVNSGNIDSMVNHYTAARKKRSDDFYSPGGKSGYRPDRAILMYCNKVREAYKDVPVIIGGIEASLRRFAHYDYWSDKIRRSILLDSKADLLIYGMGEKPIIEIANLMSYGMNIKDIKSVKGTVYLSNSIENISKYVTSPSYEEVISDKMLYAESFKVQSQEQDSIYGKIIVQKHDHRYIIQNPPQSPLTDGEMDKIYNLPYARNYHPIYEKDGGIPAIKEVKYSITSHRGCYGSCSFCALTFHQGRVIQKRSEDSIVNEAKLLTTFDDFKGYIHDVGGPTANFRSKACKVQEKAGVCKHKQCMHPAPCKNLIIDHSEYLNVLRKIRKLPGIKKVFIRSGIRYDYLIYDKNTEFMDELCEHHISGQLKVAPEHISDKVLAQMGKPTREVYDKFAKRYFEVNNKLDMKQFLVPYLMSSHPGSDIDAAIELAEYIRDMGYNPEQVQDFYPTPGSLSTTIYYTGINPITKETVYTPTKQHEKNLQRALLQYRNPKNHAAVKEALLSAGREDLIGNGRKCLIPQHQPRVNSKPNGHRATKSYLSSTTSSSDTTSVSNSKSTIISETKVVAREGSRTQSKPLRSTKLPKRTRV
ncbi:MAG: YgiQ family radical SAM protein [Clostridium sp.]